MKRFRTLPLTAALALLLFACGAGPRPKQPQDAHRFSATFLQLLDVHRAWSSSRWEQLFGFLENLGIDELILQWTMLDGRRFYGNPEDDVLSSVLDAARRHHVRVRLGLVQDSHYFSRIQGDVAGLSEYLTASRNAAENVATELYALISDNPDVIGWYLPQEIDDASLMSADKRTLTAAHLRDLSAALKKKAPAFDIVVSGFTNFNVPSEMLEAFWRDILASSRIDAVYFQDGLGVREAAPEKTAAYLSAVKRGVGAQRRFRVIVEVFRQTGGAPIDRGEFRAIPADIERIAAQLDQAAAFSDDPPAAFSIPEYMTPLGGPAAAALYEQYLRLR